MDDIIEDTEIRQHYKGDGQTILQGRWPDNITREIAMAFDDPDIEKVSNLLNMIYNAGLCYQMYYSHF